MLKIILKIFPVSDPNPMTSPPKVESESAEESVLGYIESKPELKRLFAKYNLTVDKLSKDPLLELLLLSMAKLISDKEKTVIETLYLSTFCALPAKENEEVVLDFISDIRRKFDNSEDDQIDKKEAILDVIFSRLYKKEWFKKLIEFCSLEILKSNQEKKLSVDNRTLIISGETAVGKTSFVEIMIRQIFGTSNIELENPFQSMSISRDSIQILCSPDNAKISTLYRLTLIPNGDEQIQINNRETPLNLKFKSMIVLTNHKPESISTGMKPEYRERFERRAHLVNIGSDKDLLEYFYDSIEGFEISPEFRCAHFWTKVMCHRLKRIEKGQKNLIQFPLQKRSLESFLSDEESKKVFEKSLKRIADRRTANK